MKHTLTQAAMAATAIVLASGPAHATEGGGSTYPRGVENFMVGAVPPPGLHALAYLNYYTADRLNDAHGDRVPVPGFDVQAKVAAIRPVWSTTANVLGGNVVFHTIVPLVDLKVSAAGTTQSDRGIGDITVGIGLAHHHSPQLHTVVGLDLVLPTGSYNPARQANVGRNVRSWQPLYALTWLDPAGFNADFKLTLNLNGRNKDTAYRSGDELFVDYSAGWGVGGGWTLGLGGHVWQQLSDDRNGAATVPGNRVRAYAIGPSLRYDNGKGWVITAKWQAESSVRNSTQGSAFWVKTSLPF